MEVGERRVVGLVAAVLRDGERHPGNDTQASGGLICGSLFAGEGSLVFGWVNRYNTRRRHSYCGQQPPIVYEQQHAATLQLAA